MSIIQLDSRIQMKKDTEANWTSNNPVLLDGETVISLQSDGTVRKKTGNGTSNYNQLNYDDEYALNNTTQQINAHNSSSNPHANMGWVTDSDLTASNVSFTPGSTGMSATDVQGAVTELFTSVSDGKSAIAAAITDKGVTTAADATFQQMANNILDIQTGVSITLESIEIFTPPDRTVYAVGQTFDSTGLKVIARYIAGLSKFITNYTLSPTGALTIDDEFIIISYTEDGITKTTQQSITVVEALPVLNDNPWSTISSLSQAGQASAYWAVGDAKQITLNGTIGTVAYDNYQPWVFIMGFNHNAALEGNNLIHFGCFRADQDYQANNTIALDDEFYNTPTSTQLAFHMNTTNTNTGGWEASLMRSTLLDSEADSPSQAIEFSFLAALPADLQNVLRKCTKYTNNVGNNNTEAAVTSTEEWAFLLSEWEVQGASTYANQYEQNYQQQYEYFASGNSKIKYKQTNNGVALNWWLRSPNAAASVIFCGVIASGGASYGSASFSFGFAPGFCV